MASPLVVVSGPTAAGKSTAAATLARSVGLERRTASDRLVTVLAGRAKADRLRSWLHPVDQSYRTAEADRDTDLTLLRQVEQARRALVVESVALPYLLPPRHTGLCVRLTASRAVRAVRLRNVLPDLSPGQADLIIRRKDRATRSALLSAWGIDLAAQRPALWRTDLVLTCPEADRCADERACAAATAELLTAAYAVYRAYLTDDATGAGAAAAERFADLAAAAPERIRRASPLLSEPDAQFRADRWRDRLLIELAAHGDASAERKVPTP